MKKRRGPYRATFIEAYGIGPHPCTFCGDPVVLDTYRNVVHHKNDDRFDDRLENLAPAHGGCHTRHHCFGMPGARLGVPHTDETRAKMSATRKGRKMSEQTKARMSAARQRDREKIAEKSRLAWAEGRHRPCNRRD